MEDWAEAVVGEARRRVAHLAHQMKACLEALTDEQIWSRPNDSSNSIGNLVLHTVGSSHHYLGRGVGGSDYARDRPSEFSERRPRPRAELIERIDAAAAEAAAVLAGVDAARLLAVSSSTDPPESGLARILRTTHHWALHYGQIAYATKALQEGSIRELWKSTPLA